MAPTPWTWNGETHAENHVTTRRETARRRDGGRCARGRARPRRLQQRREQLAGRFGGQFRDGRRHARQRHVQPSAATPAGASASVPFPVAVGNTWNYKITTGSESGTTVNKMTAVTPVATGQQVTMLTTDHVGSVNGSAKETYLFHADGSIGYPLGSFSPGSGVTVTSNGVVWPPASVIASGKPSQSTLNISIKAAGQALSTTAHVTVQGAGTATVTVPAGTYQTTVVLVTERLEIVGITASIQVKTWLAPDVGPVKELVTTNEGSATSVVADEELLSFTKG